MHVHRCLDLHDGPLGPAARGRPHGVRYATTGLYTEGGASKFWEGHTDGATLILRFGKLGTTGQTWSGRFALRRLATIPAKGWLGERGEQVFFCASPGLLEVHGLAAALEAEAAAFGAKTAKVVADVVWFGDRRAVLAARGLFLFDRGGKQLGEAKLAKGKHVQVHGSHLVVLTEGKDRIVVFDAYQAGGRSFFSDTTEHWFERVGL